MAPRAEGNHIPLDIFAACFGRNDAVYVRGHFIVAAKVAQLVLQLAKYCIAGTFAARHMSPSPSNGNIVAGTIAMSPMFIRAAWDRTLASWLATLKGHPALPAPLSVSVSPPKPFVAVDTNGSRCTAFQVAVPASFGPGMTSARLAAIDTCSSSLTAFRKTRPASSGVVGNRLVTINTTGGGGHWH